MKKTGLIIKNKVLITVFCAVPVLAVSFLLIPDYFMCSELEKKKAQLEQRKQVQLKLAPVYRQITSKPHFEALPRLSVPVQGSFNRSEVRQISRIFKEMVETNGLKCLESRPDVNTLTDDSKMMRISVVIKGEMLLLHNLLFEMLSLDYLDSLEQIDVTAGPSGRKYTVKAWLVLG